MTWAKSRTHDPGALTAEGLLATDRILVTGGSGLAGHALVAELHDAGYEHVLPVGSARADLTDWPATLRLFDEVRPTVVFHLAARVYGIMGNAEDPSRAYLDNIRINTNVVEASRQIAVRKVVAMGSAAIYSDSVPLPMREDDVWIGPPHHSEAPYAHAKRSMLAQLETYSANDGLAFAYCVSTNLYGPNDRFDEQWGHVLPSLVSKFHAAKRTGANVCVWGSGTPTRDFLYSLDAAAALRLVAERAEGIINVATGISHAIRDVVELLCKISGYDREVRWDTSKPDGQNQRTYDVTKLESLGFVPRWDLEGGLRATYEWFDTHLAVVRR